MIFKEEEKLITVKETKVRLQEERQKDSDVEKLVHRKIDCTDTFITRFDEHVKHGDFKDSITKQIKADLITERISKNVLGDN